MSATALSEPITSTIPLPPTQDELPYDDGVPMDTERHRLQMELLINTLRPWLNQRAEGYVGGNMFVYFSLAQVRNQDFKGPDFFVVLDVPKGERKSWVVWEEGKGPDVVIELLSESTLERDKTVKKRVYQNQLKVSEYFWFDPFNPEDWAGFNLHAGVYQALVPDEQSRLISQCLGLALVRWHGVYEDVEATWLRWATLEGLLLPTQQESLHAEQQRAKAEAQARREAEQRAAAAEAELVRLRQRFKNDG
jgi:Uma2 family endonuclease